MWGTLQDPPDGTRLKDTARSCSVRGRTPRVARGPRAPRSSSDGADRVPERRDLWSAEVDCLRIDHESVRADRVRLDGSHVGGPSHLEDAQGEAHPMPVAAGTVA